MNEARRRIGVMGGTFDPIHHGHLVAASEVQSWFDLDEVIFVPTGQPWHGSCAWRRRARTLREIAALHPDAELYFITGADALAALLTWRDHEELFDLAHFVGCTRPGHEMDDGTLEGLPKDRITLVEIPALAISSTDCRHRVQRREPVWYLVPDGVVQYIGKHQLYGPPGDERVG